MRVHVDPFLDETMHSISTIHPTHLRVQEGTDPAFQELDVCEWVREQERRYDRSYSCHLLFQACQEFGFSTYDSTHVALGLITSDRRHEGAPALSIHAGILQQKHV